MENKLNQQQDQKEDDILFDKYINPKRFSSKFWLYTVLLVFIVVFALIFKFYVIDKMIPPEVLKDSLEIFNIDSQWVEIGKLNEKDFTGIILAPQISFNFRNKGNLRLKRVFVMGVFWLQDRPKALGTGLQIVFEKGLDPGKESDRVILTSNHGYRVRSKEAINMESSEWKDASVKIHVKASTSNYILFNHYNIIRKIEGIERNIEVKIQ